MPPIKNWDKLGESRRFQPIQLARHSIRKMMWVNVNRSTQKKTRVSLVPSPFILNLMSPIYMYMYYM